MGTSGATALLSPEIYPASAGQISGECMRSEVRCMISLVGRTRALLQIKHLTSNFQRTAGSLISTYRKKNVIRGSLRRYIGLPIHDSRFNDSRNLPSFVLFEIFHLSCLPFRDVRNGLTEK